LLRVGLIMARSRCDARSRYHGSYRRCYGPNVGFRQWIAVPMPRRLTGWRADHGRALGSRASQQQRLRIFPPCGLRNPRRSLALTGCSLKLKTAIKASRVGVCRIAFDMMIGLSKKSLPYFKSSSAMLISHVPSIL
jgi:hypothetical protein